MRWIIKDSRIPKKASKNRKYPKVGDIKVILKFAFFPKNIGEYVYWLEFYKEGYQYETYNKTIPNPKLSLSNSANSFLLNDEPKNVQIEITGWRLKKTLPLNNYQY